MLVRNTSEFEFDRIHSLLRERWTKSDFSPSGGQILISNPCFTYPIFSISESTEYSFLNDGHNSCLPESLLDLPTFSSFSSTYTSKGIFSQPKQSY